MRFDLPGLESDLSGTTHFEWRDPGRTVFPDARTGRGQGTITLSRAADPRVISELSILADDAVVGLVHVSADGVSVTIDVIPTRPGYEYVRFEPWPDGAGQGGVASTVIATKAGLAINEIIETGSESVLCLLPGVHPPAEPGTTGLRLDCDSVVATANSVLEGRAPAFFSDTSNLLVIPSTPPHRLVHQVGPGPTCPLDGEGKTLEELIDELEALAAARFGERHADLIELLTDKGYWEGVIKKQLAAVGLPTSGDVYDILNSLDPGVAGTFWKAFRADLLGTGGVAFDSYLARRGLPRTNAIDWTYEQRESFTKNYSDFEQAFRAGVKEGGSRDAFEQAMAAQDAQHLAQIRQDLQQARDSLDTGLFGGDPTFRQRKNAFGWYDKALNYLRDHTSYTGGSRLSEACDRPQPPGFGDGGASGRFHAEPHMTTFDGYGYDFQAAGEFILTRAEAGDMEVHVRFVPWASSNAVTWGQAFGVDVVGDRVTGTFRERNVVSLNGTPTELGPGDDISLPGGGRVVYVDSKESRVFWPDGSSLRFFWAPRTIGLRMEISPIRLGTMSGLLGDADGSSIAELVTPDGAGPPSPDQDDQWQWLHSAFADGWRVTDETSLLPYEEGESTQSFTNRSVPDARIAFGDFDSGEIEATRQICFDAGLIVEPWLSNCVYDVLVTDEPDFAADALISQEAALERFEVDIGNDESVIIADGSVGEGSAEVQPERPIDAYGFVLEAGDRIWVETVPEGWPPEDQCNLGPPERKLYMRLVGPEGIPVSDIREIANNCPRSTLEYVASHRGTHWLLLGGINPAVDQWSDEDVESATTYGVSISKPAEAASFGLSPGDLIGPDTLGEGSGVLEVPGAVDTMTVALEAGDRVGFQPVSFDGRCSLGPGPGFTLTVRFGEDKVVLDSNQQPLQDLYVANNCGIAAEGAYWFEVPETGEYSIEVKGNYRLSKPRSGSYELLFDYVDNLISGE